MFMFEVEKLEAEKVMKPLPGRVKPGYHWYNIPLSTAKDSWDNPLNHVLVKAKKEDVVIFKIDFDSPLIEMGLIEQILKYPQISELIDEFYFEYHVNYEGMRHKWSTDKLNVYLSSSLKLFTALRERGIRAHSWV